MPSSIKNIIPNLFSSGRYVGPNLWKPSMGLFYDLSAKDIKGEIKPMSNFQKKFCGYTHGSYTKLEELSLKYRDKGLEILCFPSNQFAGQEPWPEPQIEAFVRDNWPKLHERMHLFSKIDVNGDDTHPVYRWLKESFPGDIRWNFATKFLIDHDGKPVKRFDQKQGWDEIEETINTELKRIV
ncbi:glutathione peroxidase [Reticulomyxa filosa]|uniref:Glutathione peroxidase n=1 Tax=Reticulomyxa filosa TaxID=46433 RepID=X6M0H8_RETFI|nr:glutathione peroxidase [Reticulomyxa filosa]|eukprot:ETO07126.1 glutathione peroxidase [Reticulomyxa filosa]